MKTYVERRISLDECLGSDIDLGQFNETHTFRVRVAFMHVLMDCGHSEKEAMEGCGLRYVGDGKWSGVPGEYPMEIGKINA